ncbi:MAG: hypothetical protein AAF225_14135, partial [Pseudomonadota bacterium]
MAYDILPIWKANPLRETVAKHHQINGVIINLGWVSDSLTNQGWNLVRQTGNQFRLGMDMNSLVLN